MPYSVPEFARAVRTRYPEYADWNDQDLVDSVVSKYPEYQSWLQESPPAEGLAPIGGANPPPDPIAPIGQPDSEKPAGAVSPLRDYEPETPGENFVDAVVGDVSDEDRERTLSRLKKKSQEISRLLETGLSRFAESTEPLELVPRLTEVQRKRLQLQKGILDRKINSLKEGEKYLKGERFADRLLVFAPIGVRPPEEEQYREAPEAFNVTEVVVTTPTLVEGKAPESIMQREAPPGVEQVKRAGEKVVGFLTRVVADKIKKYGELNNPLIPGSEIPEDEREAYADQLLRGQAVVEKHGITPQYTGSVPIISSEDASKIGDKQDISAAWLYLQAERARKQKEASEKTSEVAQKAFEFAENIDPAWLRLEEINESILKIEKMSPGVAAAFRAGAAGTAIDMASAMAMYSDDPDLIKQISSLSDDLASVTSAKEYESLINRTAQILPAMLTGMAVAAVPYIGKALAFSYWATQGAGSMYRAMIDAGISPETARAIAVPSGIVYGAIEMSQVGKVMGKNQFKLLQGLAEGAFKKALSAGKTFTADVIKETWDEVQQNFVEQTVIPFAKTAEGEDVDVGEYLKTLVSSSVETAVKSFPTSALVSAPGAAVGGVVASSRAKSARRDAALGEELSRVSAEERVATQKEREERGSRLEDYGLAPETFRALSEEKQDEILPRLSQGEQERALRGVSRETMEGESDTENVEGVRPAVEGRQEEARGAVQEPGVGGEEGEAGELLQAQKELESQKKDRFRSVEDISERDAIWEQMDPETQREIEEETGYQPPEYINIEMSKAPKEEQVTQILSEASNPAGEGPDVVTPDAKKTIRAVTVEEVADRIVDIAKGNNVTLPKNAAMDISDKLLRHKVSELPAEAHLQSKIKSPVPAGHVRLVVATDIDNFKALNEFGHHVGDVGMVKTQQRASRRSKEEGGDFFHIGGDEAFIVFDVPEAEVSQFVEKTKRIKDDINKNVSFVLDGKTLPIGYSMGVGFSLSGADRAMMEGKKTGKNGITIDNALKKRYNITGVKGEDYTGLYLESGMPIRQEVKNVSQAETRDDGDRREGDSQGAVRSRGEGPAAAEKGSPGADVVGGKRIFQKSDRARIEKAAAARPLNPREQQDLLDVVAQYELKGDGEAEVGNRPEGVESVAAEELSRAIGKQVIWFEGKSGQYEKNEGITPGITNVVLVNRDTKDPVLTVFNHEVAHRMRRDHPIEWKRMAEVIVDSLREGASEEYLAKYLERFDKEALDDIKSRKNPDAVLTEEFISEVFADITAEKGFWKRVAEKAPEAMRRILEIVDALIKEIKRPSYRAMDLIRPERLEAVRDAVAEAYASVARVKESKEKDPAFRKKEKKPVGSSQYFRTGRSYKPLVDLLVQYGEAGKANESWYEEAAEEINRLAMSNPVRARKIASIIARTSAQASVEDNVKFTFSALDQYTEQIEGGADNIEILVGRYSNTYKEDIKGVLEGTVEPESILRGNKTRNFYRNLLAGVDEQLEQGVTLDTWMARAMGYDADSFSERQYEFGTRAVEDAAKRLGVKPHQAQAMIWGTVKTRWEKIKPEVVKDLKRRKVYKTEVVDGKTVETKKTKDRIRREVTKRVRLSSHESDRTVFLSELVRKVAAEKRVGQNRGALLSLETVPGTATPFSPWVHRADYETKLEYQRLLLSPLYDDTGLNRIYKGAGLFESGWSDMAGAWEGASNPVRQTFFYLSEPGKRAVEDLTWRLDVASAALGYLYKQDAVAHHFANFKSENPASQNGVMVYTGRDLRGEESVEIQERLDTALGDMFPALVSVPGGYRILHFAGENETFQERVKSFLRDYYSPLKGGVRIKRFSFNGGLIENNWKEHSDGRSYRATYSGSKRPDLPVGTDRDAYKKVTGEVTRIVEEVEPRIEGIRARLDDRYGASFKRKEGSDSGTKLDDREVRGRRSYQDFFADVTVGRSGGSSVPYTPVLDLSSHRKFASEYEKYRGNFDDHIAKSIPGFADLQPIVGDAIIKSYPAGADVVDIGASEGSFIKAISALSNIKTLGVDPSPEMAETYRKTGEVKGSSYEVAAFNSDGWTEPDGTKIPGWNPTRKFDVAHEAMTFQFISPDRASQVPAMKAILKPDGIAIFEEKTRDTDEDYAEKEEKKNQYKRKYFPEKDLKEKKESVLVGMSKDMAFDKDLRRVLSDNFDTVVQFWDSGNFKGYVASDSRDAVDRFVGNLTSTDSEFSTVETPDIVKGEALEPSFKRKVEERKNINIIEGEEPVPIPSPITTKVFGLRQAQRPTLNRQEISGLLKQPGVKSIEADIINRVVETYYPDVKKIKTDDLRMRVESELMQLEPIQTSKWASYGLQNIGRYPEQPVTVVYNAPINHGVTGHFSSVYQNPIEGRTEYEIKQVPGRDVWIAIDKNRPRGLSAEEMQNYVGTAGSREVVEQWVKSAETAKGEPPVKGLFGHVRRFDDGEDRYISEMQNDSFQKGVNAFNFALPRDLQTFALKWIVERTDRGEEGIADHPFDGRYLVYLEGQARWADQKGVGGLSVKNRARYRIIKKLIADIKENHPPVVYANEEQFESFKQTWYQRLIREEIKAAAKDGKGRLLFPDQYTVAIIEGYVNDDGGGTRPYEVVEAADGLNLIAGDVVVIGGDRYVVVGSDWQEIKVAPEDEVFKHTYGQLVLDEANSIMEMYKEDFVEGKTIEWWMNKFNEKDATGNYRVFSVSAEELLGRGWEKDDVLEFSDIEDKLRENADKIAYEYISYDYDFNGNKTYLSKDGTIIYEVTGDTEVFLQPTEYAEDPVTKESFDVGSVPTQYQGILNRYKSGVLKYLRKLRKDVSVVTDENGFDWFSTEITEEDRNDPLVAFKRKESSRPTPAGKAKRIAVKPFDMVGAKYRVEDLQRHINKARGKLTRMKNEQTLLMRAQATLSLDEFVDYERRVKDLGRLEEDQRREVEDVRRKMRDDIKRIIQNYASQVRYRGDVSRMIDRAKTPRSMQSVIDDIDNRVEKNARRSLVRVLGRRMDRLNRMIDRAESGKVSGTLTPETADELRRYFKWISGETQRPNLQEIAEKDGPITSDESLLVEISKKVERGDVLSEDEKAFLVRSNMPTMEEMSSEQLVDAIRDIEHVYKTGRTIRQAQMEREKKRLDVRKGAILKQIRETTSERSLELAKRRITEAKAGGVDSEIQGIGKSFGWAYIRPELVSEWFSGHYQLLGMKPGGVTRYVWEPMKEASMNESQALAEHKRVIGEMFDAVDLSSLYQKNIPVRLIDIETGEEYDDAINLNQALFIYANSQNMDNRRHLYGSGFTDESIGSIVDQIPVEALRAVDDLISWYDDAMYPRLNSVFRRVYGVDMPKVDRYFPIQRVEHVNADNGVMQDLIQRFSTRPVGVSKGMTKRRVGSASSFKDLDFFRTVFSAMRQNEHYISFEGAASQARRFLMDREIKKAMKAKSESAYNTLWRWYQDTAAGRVAQNMTAIDKFAEFLRKNYGVFALGFNPRVMAKQVASLPLGMSFTNPGMVGQYAVQYLTNPMALERQVVAMSPYMAQRGQTVETYIKELSEAKEMERMLKIGGKLAMVREVSMAGIRQFDKATTSILWMSKFNDSMVKHGNRSRAIREADMLIRRTQPEGGLVNLPEAFRDRGVVGSMVVFTNQINQNMNTLAMLGMARRSVPKGELFSAATKTFFSLMAASAFLYLVDNAFKVSRFVDDPEGSLLYLINGVLGTFPFIGDAVDYLGRQARNQVREKRGQNPVHVWEYDPSPTLVGFAQTAVEALDGTIGALGSETTQERQRAVAKAVEAGAETLAALTGQPASMPIRAYKGAMRVSEEGPGAIFYPKSSLQDLSLEKAMSERIERPSGWEDRLDFLSWWDRLTIDRKKAFVEKYEIEDPLEKTNKMREYLKGSFRSEAADIDPGKIKFGYSAVKKGGIKNYFARKREKAFKGLDDKRGWRESEEIQRINAEEERFLREYRKYIKTVLESKQGGKRE